MITTGIEEIEGAVYIGSDIEFGVRDGRAHPGSSGQVDHAIEFSPGKGSLDYDRIANIGSDQGDFVSKLSQVRFLVRRVVVIVEVVQDRDSMTLLNQEFG